jgi:hypothetical protein
VNGPTGCGEVARGGCSFAWHYSVTRLNVLTEVERRTTTNTTLSLDSLRPLAYRLKIPRANNFALHYTKLRLRHMLLPL